MTENRIAGDDGFKDKTLLVTGATGFLGKVFIEKMLRTCPLVKKIYVIIRTKEGHDPLTRIKDLFSNPLFNLLNETRGEEILSKVVAIPGDVSEPDLGFSEENRQLLITEVELIFHIAASIRFDEIFKRAVILNVRGTRVMLELARQCRKLLVFAHISTAYSHPEEKILYEKAYLPPADPHKIIKLVELVDEDTVNMMGEKLKKDSPNNYAFTKALAESLVDDEMHNLPVIILRPSVVIPIWKDPLPGWTDNTNGPTGLFIAGGKGVLRSLYCKSNAYADFIPVDVAANGFMVAAYHYMTSKKKRIYNLTTSSDMKLPWRDVADVGIELVTTVVPFNWILWYPNCGLYSSRLVHNIHVILFHYIPAIILDSLLVLTGNKPILLKVHQKISQGFKLFEYYTNNQWDFNNDNIVECRNMLNETEAKLYELDFSKVNFKEYMYKCVCCSRRYILKEGDETLSTARRHMHIMWAVDRICKLLLLIGFGYLLLEYVVYPVLDTIYQ